MADNDEKKLPKQKPATATPGFDPKPVQVGGESLIDRLLPHVKKIAIGVVAATVVIAVVFVFVALRTRKYEGQTAKVAAVLDVASKQVKPPTPVPPDPKAKKEDTFTSAKDRATATLDAIAKQGADAPPAFRASLLVDAGKLDEAIAEYKKAQGQSGIDGVMAREGLGLALEMKASQDKDAGARQKGLEEALAAFKTMQPDDKGPRRAYALYHQGRILGLLGKKAEAKTAFEKAKEIGKDSEVVDLVDERLASLGAT